MNATAIRRHHVEAVMGTVVSIELIADSGTAPSAEAMISELADWFHHVDEVFSPYRGDSPITRIGRGDAELDVLLDHLPAAVFDEIFEVLHRCESLYAETGGVFDVWNLPSPNGTRFDPCGYVKGWSVQRAAARLEAAEVSRYCLNAGGDVLVGGLNADDEPWRIGVRHPDLPDRLAFVVAGPGPLAVATSGTYERGAHILDPRSGERVADIASITVIGPDLAEADAFATAAFAMGNDGVAWVEDRPGYEAIEIAHDLTTATTTGIARYLA